MARFELRFKASVVKDLHGLPNQEVRRILARIDDLRDEPRPQGSERLSGHALYRVRQGAYRIVYSIDDTEVVIEVVRVGHRREVYRSL